MNFVLPTLRATVLAGPQTIQAAKLDNYLGP